jgi:hypothetical protein
MTISKNFDEMHSRATARAECEHAIRVRIASSHLFTSHLSRFVTVAAIPLAETGQLYPDEDSAHDA